MLTYMNLLGYKAKDRVTGFVGVVSSVSFDLYGCVQVVLSPLADKDGKIGDGHWFDAKRIVAISKAPVMDNPHVLAKPAGAEIGPAHKPAPRCEPHDKRNGQHWMQLVCADDRAVPSLGRIQVWDFIDGHWRSCCGGRFTPEEQYAAEWRYIAPALFPFDSPSAVRTIRHAIGDISMEETIYANDWSDEELSATWRSVCSDSGTLSPAETMLVFAKRILRGEKAP